jgi:XTP/dITP diphosphohydrolase
MDPEQSAKLNLLIATHNAGKLNEFAGFLTGLPIRLQSLKEYENIGEVEETGVTFEENAVLKARGYALRAGIWAMADDSGLEVEALGGRPGVYSARYAGSAAGYGQKMAALLNELSETGDPDRRARFVSVITIADEQGEIKFLAEGICAGTIARAPRGKNGFGYDPVFIPDGFGQTFGELTAGVKDQISHRARATAKIIRYLRDFTGV